MKKTSLGFNLIELMIVVAVISILAAFAFPSYQSYVAKSNRAAAESFLMQITNRQEQYILDARQYSDTIGAGGLGLTEPSDLSGKYSFAVKPDNSTTPPSFTAYATPAGDQAKNDAKCGELRINQSGTKEIGGTASVSDCW